MVSPNSGRKSDTSDIFLRGGGLPLISHANSMMHLLVVRKQPRHQVYTTVWSLNPYPLSGLIGDTLSCHPPLITHLRLGTNRMAGAEEHPDCLPENFPDSHPVEQPGESVELPLHPNRVSLCDQSFFHTEEGGAANHLTPPPLPPSCASHYQRDTVMHH